MKQLIPTLLICLLIPFSLLSQPKYEFRAVWVATVANIDWPSKPGLSTKQQKQEIIDILNLHKNLGMNTIILQVRPAADAFYKSNLEHWSRYLTGTQGQAPDKFYDPLTFWTEECHKRGMELHAWLNPYRVAQKYTEELSTEHIAFQHPEWILKYGDKLYFDPGLPQTRTFITKVVKDIVARYDIDAIHMDDYFYPYPLKEEFPDTASFRQFNRGFLVENKADWRRDNVNITIRILNETIKATKPWVKFGISPFGVWRNKADDPLGSDTQAGATNYDHLYADIVKWQKEGWIDYCLPQLYWHIGHPAVDFNLLANWWKNHSYDRAMYIGQAPYRISATSKTKEWTESDQLPKQIEILRKIPEIKGSAFFSSNWFRKDLLGFQDSLTQRFYTKPAIVPPMLWIDKKPPLPAFDIKKSGRKVKWKTKETKIEMDKAWQSVVYLYQEGSSFDPNNPEMLYTIIKNNKIKFEKINRKKKVYEVRITVLDRLNNESITSAPVKIKL